MGETATLKRKIQNNEFVYGRLVSKDFQSALIIASVYPRVDLEKVHNQIFQAIDPIRNSVSTTLVTVSGDPEVNYQINKGVERDGLVFIGLSVLFILGMFFLIFRTWQGVVLPLAVISAASVWTMGIVGYMGDPINILTTTLPVVIVVIGSSFAIHVLYHLVREVESGNHRGASTEFPVVCKNVFRKIFSPLSMTSLTTAVGAITLLTFRIPMLQQFGAYTAVGTFASYVLAITIVPILFKLFWNPIGKIEKGVTQQLGHAKKAAETGIQKVPVAGAISLMLARVLGGAFAEGMRGALKGANFSKAGDQFLKDMARLATRHPYPILAGVGIMIAGSVHYMSRVEIGFNNLDILPKASSLQKTVKRLDKKFGGMSQFEVMIDSGRPNGALDHEFLTNLKNYEASLQAQAEFNHTFSIIPLLEKTHSVLKPNSGNLPKDEQLLAQYLLLLGMSDTGINLDNLITSDYRKISLGVTSNLAGTQELEIYYKKLRTLAREHFPDGVVVMAGGQPALWIGVMRYLVWGKIQNIMLALLLILIIVMVRYQSVVRGIVTIIPLIISVFANFGLMGLAGIKLDFVTAIITSFAMGLGIDFSIHFLAALRKSYKRVKNLTTAVSKTITGPGKAILYNAMCCIVGFSVPMFSQFHILNVFSYMIIFNMILLLVSTFLVLPAVIRVITPVFLMNSLADRSSESERRLWMATKVGITTAVIFVLTIGIYLAEGRSAEVSPEELLRKSIQASHSDHEESVYIMRLIGRGGEESKRKMKVWFKTVDDGEYQLMIKFTEPANIKGTGFLSVIKKGKKVKPMALLAGAS